MAAETQPAKRQPTAASAAPPKPPCKFHPTAVVADKAQLLGPHLIEVGENTFIHPYAKLRAEHGNVIIGKDCIIAEKTVVGPGERGGEAGCMLGDGVSIETGAVVEARRIGDHSTVEVNATLGVGCMIGKWCKVGSLCEVKEGEVLEDFTVVFGDNKRRVDATTREREEMRSMRQDGRRKEIELLRVLIPDGKVKWTG